MLINRCYNFGVTRIRGCHYSFGAGEATLTLKLAWAFVVYMSGVFGNDSSFIGVSKTLLMLQHFFAKPV